MENPFENEVKLKSNEELKEIVINFTLYGGQLISAAKRELAGRGIELSEEEKAKIDDTKKKLKWEAARNDETSWSTFSPLWKRNIVDDPNALQLYSRQVLNTFSILFSVLFGGILLAINLSTVDNRKAIPAVLIYSVLYTSLVIFIMNIVPGIPPIMGVVFNALGSIVLYNYFWANYIGVDYQYRTKPIWIPFIIGVLICVFFIWIIISGENMK